MWEATVPGRSRARAVCRRRRGVEPGAEPRDAYSVSVCSSGVLMVTASPFRVQRFPGSQTGLLVTAPSMRRGSGGDRRPSRAYRLHSPHANPCSEPVSEVFGFCRPHSRPPCPKCLTVFEIVRRMDETCRILPSWNGGNVWESNPPGTVLAPQPGFEVRQGHRALSAPAVVSFWNRRRTRTRTRARTLQRPTTSASSMTRTISAVRVVQADMNDSSVHQFVACRRRSA